MNKGGNNERVGNHTGQSNQVQTQNSQDELSQVLAEVEVK